MIGRPSGPALLLGLVAAAVAVVLGTAVAVLDSPSEARRQRLDDQRVQDLSEIAHAVDLYWAQHDAMPPDLDALVDWQAFDEVPRDPESDEPYRYRATGERTFELCAEFAHGSGDDEPYTSWRRKPGFWPHPAGEHCFELEVDDSKR